MGLNPYLLDKYSINKTGDKLNVQKIYDKHKLDNKPKYHVISGYDTKTKEWKFTGYRCNVCEQTLRTEYLANKHVCIPSRVSKRKENDYSEYPRIKTVEGKVWKPLKL